MKKIMSPGNLFIVCGLIFLTISFFRSYVLKFEDEDIIKIIGGSALVVIGICLKSYRLVKLRVSASKFALCGFQLVLIVIAIITFCRSIDWLYISSDWGMSVACLAISLSLIGLLIWSNIKLDRTEK